MQELTIVEVSGLEEQTAKALTDGFQPFLDKAREWQEKAKTLIVTDVSQTREMKMAREARLALREIRIEANKKRIELKEDSLRYGKAVQAVYNSIEAAISPIEMHLIEQEKFAENLAARQAEELAEKRGLEIAELNQFIPVGLNFGTMPEEDYQKLLNGARLQQQAEKERIAKEAAEKLERERLEAEERERIKAENIRLLAEVAAREKEQSAERERLLKEAEARHKAAQAERAEQLKREQAAADALAKERAERERVEAQVRAQLEAEAAKVREAAEAQERAKAAPDKEKLLQLAASISSLPLPELSSKKAIELLEKVALLLEKTTTFIKENTAKM